MDEADAFGFWVLDRVAERAGTGSGPLKIMYRVDGSSDLTEETLGYLEGVARIPARPDRSGW